MQQGGCEVKLMNLKEVQRRASPDAERKNLIGLQQGSNSSFMKLLLIIYKGASMDEKIKQQTKD